MPERRSLVRFAWLSVAAALVTMGMKTVAYLVTGSVGLLSDALESSVNLVAAIVAVIAIRVAEPTRITPTATPRPSTSRPGWRAG